MLNCVLIGAGYIAQNHVDALLKNNHVKIVGIVCRTADHATPFLEKIGEGCKHYPTIEDACKDNKVDFVDICVPTNLHEAYTVKAAELGCHVLCEKPVTFTVESFDRMVAACEKANLVIFTSIMRRDFASIRHGAHGIVKLMYPVVDFMI